MRRGWKVEPASKVETVLTHIQPPPRIMDTFERIRVIRELRLYYHARRRPVHILLAVVKGGILLAIRFTGDVQKTLLNLVVILNKWMD